MSINDQQLQTFLIQAELINQKVKALANNTMSPQQFDRIEAARQEDKRKKQEYNKRKQKQAFEKKVKGHSGKGISKDFASFCRSCHWEYQLNTPQCLRCKKPTMTLEQRRSQLQKMVDQYKFKKKDREQRKLKWEMWQKTKSMLWKKTSNSYDKWEYFVSDSQQQPEDEPIVPKNDPNFKALEKDIEDRKQNRLKQTQKAKKLKEKGNAEMKQGNYSKAIEYYHLALQHIKDIKSIYTNRALAYLKLGKYDKAIKDCTNVIEYMEVFGKSGQSIDLLFKAQLRRANAYKQKKQYKEAHQDVIKALQIYPKDQSAHILKRQIEGFLEHSEKIQKILRQSKQNQQNQKKVSQIEQTTIKQNLPTEQQAAATDKDIIKELAEAQMKQQLRKQQAKAEAEIINKKQEKNKKKNNPVEEIKQLVQNLTLQNIERLFYLVRSNQENLAIFLAAKGVKKCLQSLISRQQCQKQGFLVSYCLKGDGVGEGQAWEFGLQKLHAKIDDILSNPSQMKMGVYFLLEDIFEVLIPMSLHEKYRPLLAGSMNTAKFFETTFSRLVTKHKKHPDLLSSFLIYGSNLCSGTSKLRDSVISSEVFKVLVDTLYSKIVTRRTTNRPYLNLKKSVFNFYANLIINQKHRISLCEYLSQIEGQKQVKMQKWEQIVRQLRNYPRQNQNFNEYCEALLSMFVNATLGTKIILPSLTECLVSRFISNPILYSPQIINRSLLVLTRINHTSVSQHSQILKKITNSFQILSQIKEKKVMQQLIRLLNVIYSPITISKDSKNLKVVLTDQLPQIIFNQMKNYISQTQEGQVIFCNSCNFFCVIIDSATIDPKANSNRQLVFEKLRQNMKFLIQVAKQKLGNWRKNASILLAKLSMTPQGRQQLNKYHGMDVLRSIAHYVKE